VHRVIGKTPNEMNREDVQRNAEEKRKYNEEVLNEFYDKVEGKNVGILNKKNLFDKGSKMKLSKDSQKVIGMEGYNIKLDNDRSYPAKDIVLLK